MAALRLVKNDKLSLRVGRIREPLVGVKFSVTLVKDSENAEIIENEEIIIN